MITKNGASRGSFLSPTFVLCLLWTIHAARWIWIAGFGDYGWTYESAARIANHQVPYRDFISSLPPLTSYAMAPLVVLFHNSLWSWQVQLYLWWAFALGAGLMVARNLCVSRRDQTVMVVVASCISLPAVTLGHSYNYAATGLAALTLSALLRWNATGRMRCLFLAGVAAAACLFAKQNVGSMCVLMALATAFIFGRKSATPLWRMLAVLGSGMAAGATPAAYFAYQAGLREFGLQFLVDGGEGKGGVVKLLARAMPRIILAEGRLPSRWPELIPSLLLSIAAIGAAVQLVRRASAESPGERIAKGHGRVSEFGVPVALLLVMSVSLVSLFDIHGVAEVRDAVRNATVGNYSELTQTILYAFTVWFPVTAAAMLRGRLDTTTSVAILWTVGFAFACATSSVYYVTYASPLTTVLILVIIERLGWAGPARRNALVAGIAIFLVSVLYPPYGCTFCALDRLPSGGPFSALYGSPEFVKYVKTMNANVSPVILGKSALFLTPGGPHSAFGGRPVFNVISYFKDTYNSRSEAELFRRWDAAPPDYVVWSPFVPAPRARLMDADHIRLWLAGRYGLIWSDSPGGEGLSLWRSLRATDAPSR